MPACPLLPFRVGGAEALLILSARRDLPSGTITLLFSDTAGSTRLLAQLGDAYADALSAQRAILREVFVRHRGVEMGTEGDGFFLVFGSAVNAAAACLEGSAPWPRTPGRRVCRYGCGWP